jgi:hypothetical protein
MLTKPVSIGDRIKYQKYNLPETFEGAVTGIMPDYLLVTDANNKEWWESKSMFRSLEKC